MDLEKPSTHTHQERKEKIINDLGERVRVVKEVLAELDGIFALSPEEAKLKLAESRGRFMAGMPESAADKIGWLQNLEEELKNFQLKGDIDSPDEAEVDEDDVAFVANELAMEEIREQISELGADNQVALYTSLLAVYDDLEEKMKVVANYEHSGQQHVTDTMRYVATDFTEVKRDALSVVHIVRDEAWRGRKISRGKYQKGTPYIYIKQSRHEEDDYEKTLRHEQKHLVLDSVGYIKNVDSVSVVESRLKSFRRIKESGAGEFFKSRLAEFFTNETADSILNNLHNEFLAEYNTAADSYFGEAQANGLELMRELVAGDYDGFVIDAEVNRAAGSLSTAGRRFLDVIKTLDNFQKELETENYPDQALQLRDFIAHLKKRFVEIIRSLRTSIAHAYSLDNSEDVIAEVEALVHVVPPNKYEHILTYLQLKYPQEEEIDEEDFIVDKKRQSLP